MRGSDRNEFRISRVGIGMNRSPVVLFLLLLSGATVLAGPLADEGAAAAAASGAKAEAPEARIDRFHEALLGVMKQAKDLDVRQRYEVLEPIVKETFSLPLMIRLASGSHWTKGSDAEREKLLDAFERMSVATYADRFDGYSGETFETLGTKPGPQGTTLVDTRLVRTNDEPVSLVYVMREVQGEWRVVDVLLESGISELARYRSDYSKILRDRGIAGLVGELQAKTAKMLDTDVAGKA